MPRIVYVASLMSALHVLALGVGLGAIWWRGRALRAGDLGATLRADNAWGLAALLWIGTGVARLWTEKGVAFYMASTMFHVKLGLFGVILALEVWPMVTFLRWRFQQARGVAPDPSRMPLFAKLNTAEVVVVLLIPFVAAMMTRGVG